MSELSDWFWQERLWFPKGLGWADLEDRDGRVYAKARDLWVALPIALVFLIVRQIFERSVHFSLCLTRYLKHSFPSIFIHFSPSIIFLLWSAHQPILWPLITLFYSRMQFIFFLFPPQRLFDPFHAVPHFIIWKVSHIVSHTRTVFLLFVANLWPSDNCQLHLRLIADKKKLSSSSLFLFWPPIQS